MKSGDLKHPIDLLRPSRHVNDSGRKITEYTPAVSGLLSGISGVGSRDFYNAFAANALDTITFKIRWREDITTKWRIQRHGEIYEILQINPLGYERDYMYIKARLLSSEKGAM